MNTFERKSTGEVNNPMQHLFTGKWSKSVEGGASEAVGPKSGRVASVGELSGTAENRGFSSISPFEKR